MCIHAYFDSVIPLGHQAHQHLDPIFHSVTLSWHWANQFFPYASNAQCLARKRHWFDSTKVRIQRSTKTGHQAHQHLDPIFHSVTLSWHWANQFFPYASNAQCLARKRHWFDSTRVRIQRSTKTGEGYSAHSTIPPHLVNTSHTDLTSPCSNLVIPCLRLSCHKNQLYNYWPWQDSNFRPSAREGYVLTIWPPRPVIALILFGRLFGIIWYYLEGYYFWFPCHTSVQFQIIPHI